MEYNEEFVGKGLLIALRPGAGNYRLYDRLDRASPEQWRTRDDVGDLTRHWLLNHETLLPPKFVFDPIDRVDT